VDFPTSRTHNLRPQFGYLLFVVRRHLFQEGGERWAAVFAKVVDGLVFHKSLNIYIDAEGVAWLLNRSRDCTNGHPSEPHGSRVLQRLLTVWSAALNPLPEAVFL
jgi:hypothetical protein